MTHDERIYAGVRFFWLVAVPTGSCFAVWALPYVFHHDHTALAHAVGGVLPALGLLAVVAYRLSTRDFVRWWPYLPSAVGSLVFLATMEDLADVLATEGSGAAVIPVLPYGLAFVLPFVTLVGSLVAFVALKGVLDG